MEFRQMWTDCVEWCRWLTDVAPVQLDGVKESEVDGTKSVVINHNKLNLNGKTKRTCGQPLGLGAGSGGRPTSRVYR